MVDRPTLIMHVVSYRIPVIILILKLDMQIKLTTNPAEYDCLKNSSLFAEFNRSVKPFCSLKKLRLGGRGFEYLKIEKNSYLKSN